MQLPLCILYLFVFLSLFFLFELLEFYNIPLNLVSILRAIQMLPGIQQPNTGRSASLLISHAFGDFFVTSHVVKEKDLCPADSQFPVPREIYGKLSVLL